MMKQNLIKEKLIESKEILFSDPRKSYEIAMEALSLADGENMIAEQATAMRRMGSACRIMSNYRKGLDHALNAYELYEKIGDTDGMIDVLNLAGIMYFYFGDYSSALSYFVKGKAIVTEETTKDKAFVVQANIGEVHRVAGRFEEALDSYEKAMAIADAHGLEHRRPYLLMNISDIYMDQSRYDKAYDYIVEGYKDAHLIKDTINRGEIEYKYGRLLMYQYQLDAAERHFKNAMTMLSHISNKYYLVELLIYLSELDELRGESPLAYLYEALETATFNGLNFKVGRIYSLLSEYFERAGDFESALAYYKKYHITIREIDADNLSHRLELMLVENDHSKEKQESVRLKELSEKLKREIYNSDQEMKRIKEQNALLKEENVIDTLTKTYNRRGLYQMFDQRFEAKESEFSALYVVDIDHFKHYNDAWGHMQGDLCLKMVAEAMGSIDKEDFFVGRFGGEEFIGYVTVESREEAVRIGELIRTRVHNLKLPYSEDESEHYLTVSVGCVYGSLTKEDINQWLKQADNKLYEAKASGRNRLIVSDQVRIVNKDINMK